MSLPVERGQTSRRDSSRERQVCWMIDPMSNPAGEDGPPGRTNGESTMSTETAFLIVGDIKQTILEDELMTIQVVAVVLGLLAVALSGVLL